VPLPTIESTTARIREATLRRIHSRFTGTPAGRLRRGNTVIGEPSPGQSPPLFGAALALWRKRRGLTKKALAEAMGFDPSYISHIEAGRMPAGEDFARRADTALSAGGELWRTWCQASPGRPGTAPGPGSGLVVEDDYAELRYDGAAFRASQQRRLRNDGTEPVTRYMMRISVDRYPGEPERSNALYRARPLTWEQLGLIAACDGEPMHWQVKADRDAFKEAWLLLENDQGRFPLYPGQHATISYSYTVDDGRWGPWFQRAIRLPTARVAVDLVFPASLDPVVWGTETSTTAEAIPLRTPPARSAKDDCTVFSWAADDPPMGARYRLEWRFRARPGGNDTARPPLRTASERMTAAGITQAGDPVLTQQAAAFDLPAEADRAREVIDALFAALGRVREHHVFGKGMGIAAPQIGIARAAAIVIPPDPAADPLILLNPRVISESVQTDEQYEGCLSFFDVRGMVPRPLRIEVACTSLDGQHHVLSLDTAMARLTSHEIDHLNGTLYTNRMREGTQPIPVSEYRGTGHSWTYQ
jgi:peptide deformylase